MKTESQTLVSPQNSIDIVSQKDLNIKIIKIKAANILHKIMNKKQQVLELLKCTLRNIATMK